MKYTNQEAFERVVINLARQGRKSVMKNLHPQPNELEEFCAYRSGDLRCGAGWLLPDELYGPELEGLSWDSLKDEVDPDLWDKLRDIADSGLILGIQEIHDHIEPEEWYDQFMELAVSFNLDSSAAEALRDLMPETT